VERGQRIVLVGPNGAGKSTLLKLLAGVLEPQAGLRQLGHNTKPGYFSQYRLDMLHPERTVLEEALDTPRRVTELFVRTVLGAFLFRGDDVFKRVSVLSGGEKSRLALVKLLLDPPNLLLLDEPTTHLDIPSTEALLAALQQFTGTIVLISHDVFFIRHLANHVVHVRDGRLTPYPGGYDYYMEKARATVETLSALNPTGARVERVEVGDAEGGRGRERREQKRLEAEQRQARSRERREQRRAVDGLEQEIHALEQRQAELTSALEDPATYQVAGRAPEINREFLQVQAQLRAVTARWEEAATRLVELEAD
jgi:ATP-binding cassette subfamily F protein 3